MNTFQLYFLNIKIFIPKLVRRHGVSLYACGLFVPLVVRAYSSTTMEVSFAITGKGYVLVASDQNAGRSIIKMKGDEDKIKALGSHLLMAYSGEPGLSKLALSTRTSNGDILTVNCNSRK